MRTAITLWLLLTFASIEEVAGARETNLVARRWSMASRLTPFDAIGVLFREAIGEPVSSADLFEAQKHLRSDGPVSPSEYVLAELFERRLRRELGSTGDGLRLRTERPVLHWLESRVIDGGIEIRGESLQLAVVHPAAGTAAVWLDHRTRHQEWTDCGGELCVVTILAPLRPDVSYLWSRECDPSPSTIPSAPSPGHAFRQALRQALPEETRRIRCVFRETLDASLRLTYLSGGSPAFAPPRAAASAIVNNPLVVRLSE